MTEIHINRSAVETIIEKVHNVVKTKANCNLSGFNRFV